VSPIRGWLFTVALVATAIRDLWGYQVWARLHGASTSRAVRVLQRWSQHAWRWLRLDVRVDGRPLDEPCVYVANHRSYLDIPVLAGALGVAFMSRADVATWPVVGAAAQAVGSVFVERDDPNGRIRAARALARRLRSGSVAVFPEGTTTGDRLPAAFHPGLFRLLHRLGVPVVPVTIRYGDARAYWVEDVSLRDHLRRLEHAVRGVAAVVHIGAPLDARAHADGTSLGQAAWSAVSRPIDELGELA
jgi:1-acyl-sn-glycerol-3-phosphate acyltransferase